jgi:serine/threonine protein kinase
VALKVLAPERMGSAVAQRRFQREMRAVGNVNHPNVVQATDAGEVGGTHFLVMELVEGIDLGRLVLRHGPLPAADACEAVRQAALGLQHIHGHGLIHRDVKPSNLILTAGGSVKLLDLGLALLQDRGTPHDSSTASDMVMGSFDYMAPEQADNPHAPTHGPTYTVLAVRCITCLPARRHLPGPRPRRRCRRCGPMPSKRRARTLPQVISSAPAAATLRGRRASWWQSGPHTRPGSWPRRLAPMARRWPLAAATALSGSGTCVPAGHAIR